MPRRSRPKETSRSEHWMRIAANEVDDYTNGRIRNVFGWGSADRIEWRSPVSADAYAEYYDEEFLDRLGLSELKSPLEKFWPKSGPRWDGLARTSSGKILLVEAKAYIGAHGSKHTETIITENYTTAQDFLSSVDASAVMVNASTRFNDGGQLGLGTEIGISTTKLHSYGPMGLEELTTRKFIVYGTGQVRD